VLNKGGGVEKKFMLELWGSGEVIERWERECRRIAEGG